MTYRQNFITIFRVFLYLCFSNLITANVGFTAINGYRNGPYIGFKNQITNFGADFKMQFGTFRADKSGLYFFTFTAISDNNQAYRISLRKNRIPVVTAFSNQVGYSSASTSAVLNLVPGDIVYLHIDEGNIYEFSKGQLYYTSFSGFSITCDGFNNDDGNRSNRDGYNGGTFGDSRPIGGYTGGSHAPNLGAGVNSRSSHRLNNTRYLESNGAKPRPVIIENLGEVDEADKIYELLKE